MGRDACQISQAARAVFEESDDVLGFALSKLCFEGPDEALLPTEVQQPAILAASVAWLRALEERCGGIRAAYVAGHSLGEYTALVASRALGLRDALRLVRARGLYMRDAAPPGTGAMAAILGCERGVVEAACERARAQTGEVVEPANFNAPAQTVVAGTVAAVQAACEAARAAGARRARPLPVSAPFHCSLMAPAAERLARDLAGVALADPDPPVIANVTAEPNARAACISDLLTRQVAAPVRFTESVERLASLGVTRVLEVGPGRVLTGLVARIVPSLRRANLGCAGELDAAADFVTRPAADAKPAG
ncbi:MAG: [acyl-carrier-protein] S-malonyltransferase [Proteobacteria bacterium]|nr:MAG: [acyl-carrier-protein] S-malonyltransferase [Pseudomonadota bacterium]